MENPDVSRRTEIYIARSRFSKPRY